MLICPHCGNKQANGAFCGNCGGKLQRAAGAAEPSQTEGINSQHAAARHEAASSAQTNAGHAQPNATAETIKKKSRAYWTFFVNIFRNPTQALYFRDNEWTNAIISIVLYLVTFAISLYALAASIARAFSGGYGELPPLEIFFRSVLVIAVMAAISFGSLVIMSKFSRSGVSGKQLIVRFGALAVPFIALNVLTILTAMAGAYKLTFMLLAFSIMLYLYFIPGLIVFAQNPGNPKQDQRIYASIGSIAITVIVNYLLFTMMLSELLNEVGPLPFWGY